MKLSPSTLSSLASTSSPIYDEMGFPLDFNVSPDDTSSVKYVKGRGPVNPGLAIILQQIIGIMTMIDFEWSDGEFSCTVS